MPHRKSGCRWRQGYPAGLSIAKSAEAENAGATQHSPKQRSQSARRTRCPLFRAGIKWTVGRAVVEDVARPADDTVILQAVERADKTGIDCPFGWPAAFVSFVTSHHAGHVSIRADGPGSRRNLTMRRTDVFVHEQLGLTPLSVSADRIAHGPSGARFC
jgi:hypothetical protein